MKTTSLAHPGVDDPPQRGVIAQEQPWGPWGISADDWDILFDAVRVRLTLAVEDAPASALPATVLDCVTALDYLHAALKEMRRQDARPPPPAGRARDAADPC